MKNRSPQKYLFSCLAIALLSSGPTRQLEAADSARPNIVFIMADDHALEAVGCYGSWLKDFVVTPAIDQLAAEGMRFNNFCCNNSICSPSRATYLTGQYSHKNGAYGLNAVINPDSPWVSAELQKAGYQTGVFGKWHLKSRPQGFDRYKVTKGQGQWFDPTFYTDKSEWAYGGGGDEDAIEKHKGYSSDVYTDHALAWLNKRDRSKPFCLMLHFKAPHHSYEYPERWSHLHEGKIVPEPFNLHEDVKQTSPLMKGKHWGHMLLNRGYFQRHEKDADIPMWPHDGTDKSKTSAGYQHLIHKYLRCVAAVDENVQRVVDALEEQGIKDDTLIIYTSDQGYWLGQHGLYDKRLILEESLKMPFVVRYPKEIKAGSVSDALTSNVDLARTLLDYAGAPAPKAMQGRNLRPLLQGAEPGDWRKAVWYAYWTAGHPHWGVRTDRYKLIQFPNTEEFEFYDLKKDRFEMNNLAGDAGYTKAIAATEAHVARRIREVGIAPDQMPGRVSQGKSPTLKQDRKNAKNQGRKKK
jgi:arylsulfatase A-like enzyme